MEGTARLQLPQYAGRLYFERCSAVTDEEEAGPPCHRGRGMPPLGRARPRQEVAPAVGRGAPAEAGLPSARRGVQPRAPQRRATAACHSRAPCVATAECAVAPPRRHPGPAAPPEACHRSLPVYPRQADTPIGKRNHSNASAKQG